MKSIGENMNNLIRNLLLVGILASASALAATEKEAAAPAEAAAKAEAAATEAAAATEEAEVETGLVVTSEGLPERCILPLVLTAVDGKAVDEADATGRFELEPGPHSFSGYGTEGTELCATFTGENPVVIAEGDRIGESSLTVDVVKKKEYYLGIDVRSKDKSKWKIVTWKIKH